MSFDFPATMAQLIFERWGHRIRRNGGGNTHRPGRYQNHPASKASTVVVLPASDQLVGANQIQVDKPDVPATAYTP